MPEPRCPHCDAPADGTHRPDCAPSPQEVVGQATGLLMAGFGLSADDARRRLASGAQDDTLGLQDAAEAIVEGHQPSVAARSLPVDLSEREGQTLELIAQGLSNREIAEALGLGVNSVKTHTRTLFRKIGVSSRTEAALWAVDHGVRRDPGPGGEGDRRIGA